MKKEITIIKNVESLGAIFSDLENEVNDAWIYIHDSVIQAFQDAEEPPLNLGYYDLVQYGGSNAKMVIRVAFNPCMNWHLVISVKSTGYEKNPSFGVSPDPQNIFFIQFEDVDLDEEDVDLAELFNLEHSMGEISS